MLLLLVGLALTALAVVMLARLLVVERTPPARLQAQIEAYGFEAAPADSAPRPLSGRVDALAATLGSMLASRMKNFREDVLRKELQAAGLYTMSAAGGTPRLQAEPDRPSGVPAARSAAAGSAASVKLVYEAERVILA